MVFLMAAVYMIPKGQDTKKLPVSPSPASRTTETVVTAVPAATGIQEYTMGSFTGMKRKAGVRKLRKQDKTISIGWKYQYSDHVKKGRIISQSIRKNTKYREGTYHKLIFTVSKGRRKTVVPVQTSAPTPAVARKQATPPAAKKQTDRKAGIEFEGAIP